MNAHKPISRRGQWKWQVMEKSNTFITIDTLFIFHLCSAEYPFFIVGSFTSSLPPITDVTSPVVSTTVQPIWTELVIKSADLHYQKGINQIRGCKKHYKNDGSGLAAVHNPQATYSLSTSESIWLISHEVKTIYLLLSDIPWNFCQHFQVLISEKQPAQKSRLQSWRHINFEEREIFYKVQPIFRDTSRQRWKIFSSKSLRTVCFRFYFLASDP